MTHAFNELVKQSRAELANKQPALIELSLFPESRMESGTLLLGLRGKTFLKANMLLIGSRGLRSQTWLWAWANASLDKNARERASVVRDFGTEYEYPPLVADEPVPASAQEAWDLAAVAAHVLSALGIFRTQANDSDWYFAVLGLERPEDGDLYARVVEHLINETIVEGGNAEKINLLRDTFPEVRPSVIEADLRGDPEPWAHDLNMQILWDLPYPSTSRPRLAKRKIRDLVGVNLAGARLDGANLRDIELANACFDGAVLIDADLTRSDLRGASFRGAFMSGTNLTGAALAGADFEGAELGRTLLARVDLSEVRGLAKVHHAGPSEVGLSTLIESSFQIPRAFLQAAGVSRGLLEDFDNGKRFPNTYQTCFLSYSSEDSTFAAALYRALIDAGVRLFWDEMNMVPGDALERRLAEAIREHDRFMVVFSLDSMRSRWVRKELELVWHSNADALLPVRICPLSDIRRWISSDSSIPDLVERRRIADFEEWTDSATFAREVDRVLQSLRG